MRILIATIGTRGDVQPYVALGQSLKKAGHDVSMCTCEHFEPFIRENELDYSYVNNDLIDFMHTKEGKIILGNAGNFWQTMGSVASIIPKLGKLQERQMADVWQAARETSPDLIVYHPKSIGAPDFAEKLGVPCMLAFWLPLYVKTKNFPAMGFPDLPLGPGYRRLTYTCIRMVLSVMSRKVRKWRTRNGLSPNSPGFKMRLPDGGSIPVLHGFSRYVIPRPEDWPESATVTGYWYLNQADKWNPPLSLLNFLENGESPLYFGFGSIFGRDPKRVTRIILEAIRRTGVRAILAQGWGGLELLETATSDSVMYIKDAPHEWLFPKVRAVVHHGGCGTTAAGLQAGKPSLICPFFGDQPFWGRRLEELGVGTSPLPQHKITVERLCKEIDTIMNDEMIHRKADALSSKIRKENGTTNAVTFIHQWMDKYAEMRL